MKLIMANEQDIRDTIVSTFDISFFVEAGAGAGKTTLIATRVVNQLMSGWTTPERIVAITFTNEATRELKDKIFDKVESKLKENAKNPGTLTDKECKNLESARDNLDQMQISTIHGLCNRLLTEKSFEAGLPIGFSLLEPEMENGQFNAFFVKWMEKNVHSSDWNALLEGCNEKWKIYNRLSSLAKTLYSLSADMNVETNVSTANASKAYADVDTFLADYKKELNSVLALVPYHSYDITTVPDGYLNKFGQSLKSAFISGNRLDILNIAIKGNSQKKYFINPSPIKNDYEDALRATGLKGKAVTEKLTALASALESQDGSLFTYIKNKYSDIVKWADAYKNQIFNKYVEISQKAADDYRKDFPAGIITNDKLLQKTYELLESSPEVKDFFASKFDCIYVDEFQDTDHIQDGFIRMLVENDGVKGSIRDGALFVVGDPKQSIYRFRGAEPEVYFSTRDWIEDPDVKNAYFCRLNYNFRSDRKIIDWVNIKFAGKSITGKVPYVSMTLPPSKAGIQAPISVNQVQGIYKYQNPDVKCTTIEEDADAVCRLITGMHGNKDIEDEGTIRKIKYSDFLVLCANTYHMDVYVQKMKEYQIPFTMIAKVYATTNYYLNAFIRMYAFTADPYDKGSIEGALETLAISGSSDTKDNLNILDVIRNETRRMSGYGCLKYLIEHMDLVIKKGLDIDLYETSDLQRKLYQMTENIMISDHDSRGDILRKLKDYASSQIVKEIVLEEKKDVVRFMNLHQAKGLEGGIVIWTNRYENKEFKAGNYRKNKYFYPDIEDDNQYGLPTVVWSSITADPALASQAETESIEELIRLEYVAATRAKQALIFMDSCSDGNPLFSEGYELDKLPSIASMATGVMQASSTNATAVAPQSAEERLADKAASKAHSVKLFRSVVPSKLEDKKAGKDIKKQDTESDRVRGNIVGLSMHRCFELVMERREMNPTEPVLASDMIKKMCVIQALNENSEFIPAGEFDRYKDFLAGALKAFEKWFVSHDEYKDAEKIYTELPFSYMITDVMNDFDQNEDNSVEYDSESADNDAKPPVWMHGEADLVIKLKDGTCHIIDYKSDDDSKYPDEESFVQYLNQKYTPQVAEYKRAVSGILDIPKEKISVFLVSFTDRNTVDSSIELRLTKI